MEFTMCVALPGKVLEVNGTTATVDFSGNTVQAQAGLVQVKPGDYVLVHAGCILQVLSKEDNDMLQELFEEVENA
jgi:hydrogenase expression/formation protein HypC